MFNTAERKAALNKASESALTMSIPEQRVPSGQRKSIQTEKVNENVNIMVSDTENPKGSISHFLGTNISSHQETT